MASPATPQPPQSSQKASSFLIIADPLTATASPIPVSPTPAPDFALVRSTTFTPAQLEEEEKEEERSLGVSARPLRINPGPEEQLFQSVQDGRFKSRFESPAVGGNGSPVRGGATALPITATTARPRLVNPVRHRVVSTTQAPKGQEEDPEYEYYYEYYYDYYDDDENLNDASSAASVGVPRSSSSRNNNEVNRPILKAIDDYDLAPIINKVRILSNGKTECLDVGVFPHPHSCRKFVMCSRRATREGITGWVYECPAYLAFDPVGGRCNWATDVVCA